MRIMSRALNFPEPCLLLLAGPSGCGKSTWAARHFQPGQIKSSDQNRARIGSGEEDQSVTGEAFELLRIESAMRLKAGYSAVIDATNLLARDRKPLVELAIQAGVEIHLLIFNVELQTCLHGQKGRGREVPERAVRRHHGRLLSMLADARAGRLKAEGFESVTVLDREEADEIKEVRFASTLAEKVDVIGDIHGCVTELILLLDRLGYAPGAGGAWRHPEGRVVAFLADFADRGPDSLAVFRLVDKMVEAGSAIVATLGNHDWKLYRHLVLGRDVRVAHGLDKTLNQLLSEGAEEELREILRRLLERAPAYTEFPESPGSGSGGLVLCHGALRPEMLGQRARLDRRDRVSELTLYGEKDGDDPETGLPHRTYGWADAWKDGNHTVVFGHDVLGREPQWLNPRVLSLDTGCVFGGQLSAFRWPERETVSVPSSLPVTHEKL